MRSDAESGSRPPLLLPRGRVTLTILLPVGSEPGAPTAQLLATPNRRYAVTGAATLADSGAKLDTTALPTNCYHRLIQEPEVPRSFMGLLALAALSCGQQSSPPTTPQPQQQRPPSPTPPQSGDRAQEHSGDVEPPLQGDEAKNALLQRFLKADAKERAEIERELERLALQRHLNAGVGERNWIKRTGKWRAELCGLGSHLVSRAPFGFYLWEKRPNGWERVNESFTLTSPGEMRCSQMTVTKGGTYYIETAAGLGRSGRYVLTVTGGGPSMKWTDER